MASNMIFFAWNHPIHGRERISVEHFGEFAEYLGGLQANGTIEAFDAAFLDAHGGDMNGFFLIRGESAKLDGLMASDDWVRHQTRATLHLEGSGAVRGAIGDLVMQRMEVWSDLIPE